MRVSLLKKVKLAFKGDQDMVVQEDKKLAEIPVVTAKIESINAFGEVVIRFNTSM